MLLLIIFWNDNGFEKKCKEDFSKKIVFEEKKRMKTESNKETQTDQGV